jgi:hypothetical protein
MLFHTEGSSIDFTSRASPAPFTVAPVVARLDPRGCMPAVKVVRLLQAVLPIQDDVHDPLLTRLDPG